MSPPAGLYSGLPRWRLIYPNIFKTCKVWGGVGSRGPPNLTEQKSTMNRYLKTVVWAIVMSAATHLQAESNRIDLGATYDVDVEINSVTNHNAYEVRLYDDGNLALAFDAGGVTYAASGISYYLFPTGHYGYAVYGFSGNVTASLSISNESHGAYSYNSASSYEEIGWSNGSSQWVLASFWP